MCCVTLAPHLKLSTMHQVDQTRQQRAQVTNQDLGGPVLTLYQFFKFNLELLRLFCKQKQHIQGDFSFREALRGERGATGRKSPVGTIPKQREDCQRFLFIVHFSPEKYLRQRLSCWSFTLTQTGFISQAIMDEEWRLPAPMSWRPQREGPVIAGHTQATCSLTTVSASPHQ